jgi:type 1 glutamine amidotransferase
MMRARAGLFCVVLVLAGCSGNSSRTTDASLPRILLFTRTKAYHHASIPAAVAAIRLLGQQHGFRVDITDDPASFTSSDLGRYRAVVFLLTTGDALDAAQQAAFERYIRDGGGYAGVHSAADTEYGWAWYGSLVGAFFKSHPPAQRAQIRVADPTSPATAGLPNPWTRTDEWYNFRTDPSARVHVLLMVDEATYSGGSMGADHPISWCHAYDGGRAWYTALGHDGSSYRDPTFLRHLLGGISIAAGLAGAVCA